MSDSPKIFDKDGEIYIISKSMPLGLPINLETFALTSGLIKTRGSIDSKVHGNFYIDDGMVPLYASYDEAASSKQNYSDGSNIVGWVSFTDSIQSVGNNYIFKELGVFCFNDNSTNNPSVEYKFSKLTNENNIFFAPGSSLDFKITGWGVDSAGNDFMSLITSKMHIDVDSDTDKAVRTVTFDTPFTTGLLTKTYYYSGNDFSYPGYSGLTNDYILDFATLR